MYHRLLVKIRVAPDTDLVGYPANIFAGYPKEMSLYLVVNKSAYRSLLYIDIILFVKTIFDFKQFF